MSRHPFRHDPSNTAAFAALSRTDLHLVTQRGTRAVVIGGGTGAPVSIRTLLSIGIETSAVVAMADDGGSTGILRDEADVTPPGDVRKCIAAFAADPDDPLTRAFKYRFEFARNHSLGNLMLSALEDACQSFPEAVAICERLLNARGHVYPSTLDRVVLVAQTRSGDELVGQANACSSKTALRSVKLTAAHQPRAFGPAIEAIEQADLIVLGPGSLFTSIIANLLIPGILDAIRASKGCTVFVCSLADVQGETLGLSALEHVGALMDHGMRGLLDCVLLHAPPDPGGPGGPGRKVLTGQGGAGGQGSQGVVPVAVSEAMVSRLREDIPFVMCRDMVDPLCPTWHDPRALRAAFAGVLRQCRSPRR